jgi:hypothetical protein
MSEFRVLFRRDRKQDQGCRWPSCTSFRTLESKHVVGKEPAKIRQEFQNQGSSGFNAKGCTTVQYSRVRRNPRRKQDALRERASDFAKQPADSQMERWRSQKKQIRRVPFDSSQQGKTSKCKRTAAVNEF